MYPSILIREIAYARRKIQYTPLGDGPIHQHVNIRSGVPIRAIIRIMYHDLKAIALTQQPSNPLELRDRPGIER